MTEQEKINLADVISKIKQIAKDDYKDEVYDNILSIFNKLSVREKRTLLKGLINICFIVEDSVHLKTKDLHEVTAEVKTKIEEEFKDVEELNRKSLIDLRNWLAKFAALGLAIFIGLFALMSWFFDPIESSLMSRLGDKFDTVIKVLKIIFP